MFVSAYSGIYKWGVVESYHHARETPLYNYKDERKRYDDIFLKKKKREKKPVLFHYLIRLMKGDQASETIFWTPTFVYVRNNSIFKCCRSIIHRRHLSRANNWFAMLIRGVPELICDVFVSDHACMNICICFMRIIIHFENDFGFNQENIWKIEIREYN